jgi:hypothetical protein
MDVLVAASVIAAGLNVHVQFEWPCPGGLPMERTGTAPLSDTTTS